MLAGEEAILLGPRKSIVGVVSWAEGTEDQPGRPTFVLLNSGIIHRVGTNRMTVALSRALAAAGFSALRFDLSGIGDSLARTEALPPLQAGLADLKEVLDSFEAAYESRRFILAGLCSGADLSVLYASSDPRVVGMVLLDPSIPRTPRYYLYYFLTRACRARTWIRVMGGRHPLWRMLRGRLRQAIDPAAAAAQRLELTGPDLQSTEVRRVLEQAYQGAVDNALRICAIFTGGIEDQHNYRNQLLEAFPRVPFGDRLSLEYFRSSDHMFTSEGDRRRVIDLIASWAVDTTFPSREPVPSSRVDA